MKSPVPFAQNYLFFRFPINYLIIIIPQTIGLFATVFSESIAEPTEDSGVSTSVDIMKLQVDIIDDYLLAFNLTVVLLLAFFLCYRWSSMQNDGSYGYWITQGVRKPRFYLEAVVRFTINIYSSAFLGLLIIFYLNGIYLETLDFILLNLLMVSHILLVILIAIFIGNIVKNPELAALSYISILGINYSANTNKNSLSHQIFQSDFQYSTDNGWVALVSSLVVAVVLLVLTLRLHTRLDVDM
ncbi:MAG: hypothetical protein ACW99F_16760 [Candidatus Hodarchaeales archaeon]|jgi:hypothetical protein